MFKFFWNTKRRRIERLEREVSYLKDILSQLSTDKNIMINNISALEKTLSENKTAYEDSLSRVDRIRRKYTGYSRKRSRDNE